MAIEKEPVRLEQETRCLIVPEMYNQLGVQADHFVTEIPFELPELVGEGWRLADANVYINYLAPSGEAGAYLIEDLAVTKNSTVTGTWILTQNATAVRGPLRYLVCAKWTDGKELIAEWHSKIATGIVATGIEATEQIAERDADVIEQILARLGETIQADYNQMDSAQPDYIKNRPVYDGLTAKDYLIATEVKGSGQAAATISDKGDLEPAGTYTLNLGATLKKPIVWDGSTDGKITYELDGETIVRISEEADVSPDDFSNCIFAPDSPTKDYHRFFVAACSENDLTDKIKIVNLRNRAATISSLSLIIITEDHVDTEFKLGDVKRGIYVGAWLGAFRLTPEISQGTQLVYWGGIEYPGVRFGHGDGGWDDFTIFCNVDAAKQRVFYKGPERSGFELRGPLKQIKLLDPSLIDPSIYERTDSMGITGATVGQTIKVKAVDAEGKPTEWEAAEAASGGEVQWHKIAETTTTEEIAEYVVNQDADGKAVKSYNPIAFSLYFYIPADSTQASANGSPWIYPSASNSDAAIRCIGSIGGWKTAARVCTAIFFGGENGIIGLGNAVAQVDPVGRENEMMDGIRIKINTAGDHFPIGTHFIVSALGVKP